jgi:IMP cyclohydrolase
MAEYGRERLKSNPYPGRGIILGLDATGRYAMQIYWITARSEGSKNRILEIEGEDVRTQPFDSAERSKDPNIWYRAIARVGDRHVVSNGVQTDTIVGFLNKGKPFAEAVRTTSYETDEPNFTPRIAGMTELNDGRVQASFGMAFRHKSGHAQHNVYGCQPDPGMGRCIHTYLEDGNPVPAFTERPYDIELPGTPEEAAAGVWGELLPPEKRVAMALKVIEVNTGEVASLTVKNERT